MPDADRMQRPSDLPSPLPFDLADEEDRLATLRAGWLDLMRRRLPAAAVGRRWPISRDHCFGRVVLDAVYGRPWRQAVRAPAWRHMDVAALTRAIDLGEAILDGTVDLAALNRASLAARARVPTTSP